MRARASANYSGKFYESARTASTGADTRLLLFGGDSADTARGSQYPTPCVEVMHQHHWRIQQPRSEERRVGKECRSRGSPDHEKKKEDDHGVLLGWFHEHRRSETRQ